MLLLTQDMDRPVLLPPGVPAERVAQMRQLRCSPPWRTRPSWQGAQGLRLHLEPVRGEDLAKALAAAYAVAPDVVAAARKSDGREVGGPSIAQRLHFSRALSQHGSSCVVLRCSRPDRSEL